MDVAALRNVALILGSLVVSLLVTLTAGTAFAASKAPEPLRLVDPGRLFAGTWLEIARRPMWITDGCVAGTTSYSRQNLKIVDVVDACHQGSPTGRLRSISGVGLLDPKTHAKLHVRYGFFISRDYWIIDHDKNYQWFIEASPDFKDAWIFTRKAPSKKRLADLVKRVEKFGYDTRQFEYPAPRLSLTLK